MLTSTIVRSWELVSSTIKIFNAMLGVRAVTLHSFHEKPRREWFTASAVHAWLSTGVAPMTPKTSSRRPPT